MKHFNLGKHLYDIEHNNHIPQEDSAMQSRSNIKRAILTKTYKSSYSSSYKDTYEDLLYQLFLLKSNSIDKASELAENLIGNKIPLCSQIDDKTKARLIALLNTPEYHASKAKQLTARIKKARKKKEKFKVAKTAKEADEMDELYASLVSHNLKDNIEDIYRETYEFIDKDDFVSINNEDSDICDEKGNHVIHICAKKNNALQAREVLSNDFHELIKYNKDGDGPMHIAIRESSQEFLKMCFIILESKTVEQLKPIIANYNYEIHTPLHIAVMCSDFKTIHRIFKIILLSMDNDIYNNLSDLILMEDVNGKTLLGLTNDKKTKNYLLEELERVKAKYVKYLSNVTGEDKNYFNLEVSRWQNHIDEHSI